MSNEKWAMHFKRFRTRTEVRELFAKSLERMRELPPEPIKREPIIAASTQVRPA
jgi:hypothetical protein